MMFSSSKSRRRLYVNGKRAAERVHRTQQSQPLSDRQTRPQASWRIRLIIRTLGVQLDFIVALILTVDELALTYMNKSVLSIE